MTQEKSGVINKLMKWCRTLSYYTLSLPFSFFFQCSVRALVLPSWDLFQPSGSLQCRLVETRKPLWLKWLETEPWRWAIDSVGDFFRMCSSREQLKGSLFVYMFLQFNTYFYSCTLCANSGHKRTYHNHVGLLCVCMLMCQWRVYSGVWDTMPVSFFCLQMLYEIGQAQSKPCGINLARANTLGGLLIIEKASAPINVAL